MAFETTPENVLALERLALRPTDHVLEVSCGHGRTVQRTAACVPQGYVAGVDVSDQMVRMAWRRNRALIKDGRVEIMRVDSAHLPYPDIRFDRVLSVHTVYFWVQPSSHLREIARVMKRGARLLLCCRPGNDPQMTTNFPASIYRFYQPHELICLLQDVGFEGVAPSQWFGCDREGARPAAFLRRWCMANRRKSQACCCYPTQCGSRGLIDTLL